MSYIKKDSYRYLKDSYRFVLKFYDISLLLESFTKSSAFLLSFYFLFFSSSFLLSISLFTPLSSNLLSSSENIRLCEYKHSCGLKLGLFGSTFRFSSWISFYDQTEVFMEALDKHNHLMTNNQMNINMLQVANTKKFLLLLLICFSYFHTYSKITYFSITSRIQHNVFWFNISLKQ